MWNAVYLSGVVKINQLNLRIAVEKLGKAIANKDDLCNLGGSKAEKDRIWKAFVFEFL